MAMGYNKNRSFSKPMSTEAIHMGTFVHTAEDMLVLKLECAGIPYPNSPVMYKSKMVGKVDEVFGSFNEPYVSVKLDGSNKAESFRIESKFEGYKEKFMAKDRFLPREEVEKRKEMKDKKLGNKRKGEDRREGRDNSKFRSNDKRERRNRDFDSNGDNKKYEMKRYDNKRQENKGFNDSFRNRETRKPFNKQSGDNKNNRSEWGKSDNQKRHK